MSTIEELTEEELFILANSLLCMIRQLSQALPYALDETCRASMQEQLLTYQRLHEKLCSLMRE